MPSPALSAESEKWEQLHAAKEEMTKTRWINENWGFSGGVRRTLDASIPHPAADNARTVHTQCSYVWWRTNNSAKWFWIIYEFILIFCLFRLYLFIFCRIYCYSFWDRDECETITRTNCFETISDILHGKMSEMRTFETKSSSRNTFAGADVNIVLCSWLAKSNKDFIHISGSLAGGIATVIGNLHTLQRVTGKKGILISNELWRDQWLVKLQVPG